MKIIILEHEPYQERKKSHYFINEFKESGFEVEYWGLHKILHYVKNVNYPYEEIDDYVKYFETDSELFLQLREQNVENTVFVIEFWYTAETETIFKFLFKNKFKWVRIDYYINPTRSLEARASLKEMLKWSILKGNIFTKINNLLKRRQLPKKYNIPYILFHTGTDTKFLGEARKYISLDYYDILTYEKIKNTGSILDLKYIVFLDIMLVNHPDVARSGNKNILNKKEYFYKLNMVFEFIEKELGLPIVIASHPKANYTNEYGNRTVIKNKTAELVVNSEMVLTHGSLSVSYALLAHKKIGYIDLKELFNKNLFLRDIQESLYYSSNILDAILIREDSDPNILFKEINLQVYEKFLEDYFRKSERNNKIDNFQIIKDNLLKI